MTERIENRGLEKLKTPIKYNKKDTSFVSAVGIVVEGESFC